jgi:putative ABC transport system permease protein
MFMHYLKVAYKSFVRQRGYSLINIVGLAIGMACCILILLWVQDEVNFDRFYDHADSIYRVISSDIWNGARGKFVLTPAPVGPALKEDFANIERFTRFVNIPNILFETDNKKIVEDYITTADMDFFQMFSFPFLYGDSKTALMDKYSVVLTKDVAEKYFGHVNPIGKTMMIGGRLILTVTGVVEDVPQNSSFRFHMVVPFELLEDFGIDVKTWHQCSYHTFVELRDGTQPISDDALTALYRKNVDDAGNIEYHLQHLSDIHLYSHYIGELNSTGDIKYIYLFSLIALVILLVACINFMNLSIARSVKRAREIGMRKVVGAFRWDIIKQFLSESIVMAVIALILAMVIVELVLPDFNDLSQKNISLNYSNYRSLLLGLFGITMFTGILAGSYPAIFLSSFKPIKILKGSGFYPARRRLSVRKVLIVSQFTVSIALIICTLVIHQQIDFMRNKKLGFDQEHLLCIKLKGESQKNYQLLRTELLQYPGVVNVTAASDQLLHGNSATFWKKDDKEIKLCFLSVDYDFIETLGLQLAEGRSFSREFSSDSCSYILNQAATKAMGFDTPVGQRIAVIEKMEEGPVIGVVRDFHFQTLNAKIEPLVLFVYNDIFKLLYVKIRPENTPATLAHMEKTWKKFESHYPFNYEFVDEGFDSLYRSEMRISAIFSYATILAIAISCMGLLGLAAFLSEQRTKEIGVRKVLGASIINVISHLSHEFLWMVLIANIFAWPLAYFATNKWLQDFAYHINIGWSVFVLAAVLALLIAIVTVCFQSIKAALANPVDSLRYE